MAREQDMLQQTFLSSKPKQQMSDRRNELQA